MFSWLFVEKSDVSADEGPRDLPEPDPALFERANWRPADEAGSSVQRSVQRSVQLSAPGSSGRGAGSSSSSGSCLFDRYGGGTVRTASRLEGIGANGTTLSARLRTSGIMRLMCYVNTDDRGSPAAFVPVPESMRTLKDVLAVIQRIMKLDKRFLYARQLFLPDGEVVTSYRALAAAASNDTPVTARVDMERHSVLKVGLKAARPLASCGAPEASPNARSCLRLAGASASLGQSAAWAALAGHIGRVHARHAAHWAGLLLGVPSCPEPPGTP